MKIGTMITMAVLYQVLRAHEQGRKKVFLMKVCNKEYSSLFNRRRKPDEDQSILWHVLQSSNIDKFK